MVLEDDLLNAATEVNLLFNFIQKEIKEKRAESYNSGRYDAYQDVLDRMAEVFQIDRVELGRRIDERLAFRSLQEVFKGITENEKYTITCKGGRIVDLK